MRSIPTGAAASLRALPPGTFAAACSGDLFSVGNSRRAELSAAPVSATAPRTREVAYSVFEVDPPIPLSLNTRDKVELAMQRARLVSCNAEMVELCGYASIDEVEGASLGELVGRPAYAYFGAFFEHDLLHEGLTEEQDVDGRVRIFANRSVGLDRDGMLYELLGTKRDFPGERPHRAWGSAIPDAASLVPAVRRLGRKGVAEVLDRVHIELVQRRHALLAHQEHTPTRGWTSRLRPVGRERVSRDPQVIFERAQATVVCVLARMLRLEAGSEADTSQTTSGPSAGGPAHRPAPGAELSRLLRCLDAVLPGAAEQVLAEIILHWKAKEDLLRRHPPRPSLLRAFGRRSLRSAARTLLSHLGLRPRRAPATPGGA